jgi:hypothetical protein
LEDQGNGKIIRWPRISGNFDMMMEEEDETSARSCPVADFSINGVAILGFATIMPLK